MLPSPLHVRWLMCSFLLEREPRRPQTLSGADSIAAVTPAPQLASHKPLTSINTGETLNTYLLNKRMNLEITLTSFSLSNFCYVDERWERL